MKSVGINFLQPTFNKGSTFPYPAEVLEEKSYEDMGEADLCSSSSLGESSIFFSSSVL